MDVPLRNWGATPDEVAAPMVGDELITRPPMSATRSISIDAPASAVFPWLVQMGFRRAGWYSYDWIDNLGRPSSRSILPEFQQLSTGDAVPGGPIDFVAEVVEPPHALVISFMRKRIEFTLAFEVRSVAMGRCRLVSRARSTVRAPGGFLFAKLLEIGDGIMVRKQLLNLRERAESGSGERSP